MNLFGSMKNREGDLGYFGDKGVMMSNSISMLLCLALSVLHLFKFVNAQFNPYRMSINIHLIGMAIFLLPVLLNKLSFTVLARMVLCLGSLCFVWSYYVYNMIGMQVIEVSVYDGLRVYMLAMGIIPFLVFDYKSDRFELGTVFFITLMSILFFDEILGLFGVGYYQRGISGENFATMKIMTLMAIAMISGGSFIFQKTIHVTLDLHREIAEELQCKSDIVLQRNEELKVQEDKLNEANQHLGDLVRKRSHKIKTQNAKLISYANLTTKNARRPMARLKSLIKEYKGKKCIDYPCLFENIGKESNQAEMIIREISKELNEIDYNEI